MRVRGLRMPCLAACAGIVLAAVSACQTVRPDQVAVSAGTEEAASLDTFDARLLEVRLAPNAAALAVLRADLDRSAAQPGLGRRLVARVDALRAEAALLASDTAAARRHLAEAASLSESEEGVWVVRALLESDPEKRLALLEQGIARAENSGRLLCERGAALLAAGRYAEAAQDLDEGLRALDPGYGRLYGDDRDRAFALARAARDAGGAQLHTEGLEVPLTLRSMVERTAADTRLLSGLSADPNTSFGSLLPSLKSAALLLDPAASPDAQVPRKAVAWFLWGLVARAEHDPRLLTKYRSKYSISPVPDVASVDPWFDAVLGMVEREYMDLPDGVRFRPDDPVTGYELVAMLARLKKLAP